MKRLTVKEFNFTSNFVASNLQSYPIAEALKKLQEYENAEEQGLLLRLPCKIGDRILYSDERWKFEFVVDKIVIEKDRIAIYKEDNSCIVSVKNFDKYCTILTK